MPSPTCVTIWASSMAAMAGLSQPLELSTSTQAWISLIALPKMVWEHVM